MPDIESPEQLGRDPLLGSIFENMVVAEALKTRFNAGKRANLYFFRDTRGFEIDLILEQARRPKPIEIKSGMTFRADMLRNLEKFSAMAPEALPPTLIYGGTSIPQHLHTQVLNFADFHRISLS